MNKKNQSNSSSSGKVPKIYNQKKYFVPDSEDAENDIEIVQKQKKNIKKAKNKKFNLPNNGIVTTTQIPNECKKLQIKEEEKEVIEFVLGDFDNFHKMTEIKTFKNMTSLTLVYESIKKISDIIENLPNPAVLKHLCLNENQIKDLNGVEKLINLEQ